MLRQLNVVEIFSSQPGREKYFRSVSYKTLTMLIAKVNFHFDMDTSNAESVKSYLF